MAGGRRPCRRGEFGDFVGEGHEVGDWAEGLVGEGVSRPARMTPLAKMNEFQGEVVRLWSKNGLRRGPMTSISSIAIASKKLGL